MHDVFQVSGLQSTQNKLHSSPQNMWVGWYEGLGFLECRFVVPFLSKLVQILIAFGLSSSPGHEDPTFQPVPCRSTLHADKKCVEPGHI